MSEELKGHGHVTPNADGFLARCGGPSICSVCKAELAALKAQEPVGYQLPPFAQKVIRKLERFQECTDDGQGADIGRHWFDLLTQLGLLNRVQRSPALWEITQQGEDLLAAAPAAPAADAGLLDWAVDSWHREVSFRPLVNVHRSALDGTWRQVIRKLGGDPVDLCGPSHFDLINARDFGHE